MSDLLEIEFVRNSTPSPLNRHINSEKYETIIIHITMATDADNTTCKDSVCSGYRADYIRVGLCNYYCRGTNDINKLKPYRYERANSYKVCAVGRTTT